MLLSRSRLWLVYVTLLSAAVAGCVATGGARPGAPATPALRVFSYLPAGRVAELTFTDARATQSVRTTSFAPSADEVNPHSAWYPLREGTPVDVTVTLLGEAGAPLSRGQIRIRQPEREWLYEAQVQVIRFVPGVPRVPCRGCSAEARFPVRESAGLTPNDSLVVSWSARHATLPMPPS
ncbi:MAG TPA: hypothetical protein VF625_10370 [Longimicrobium sp.]|jgi:hypothetical protein